ncbi:MAG: type III secretion system chaperone [Thermodesulforhabdaceae bacterium]|jgi:hypothetical protein
MNTTEMLNTLARQLKIDGFGMSEDGKKQLVFDGEMVVVFDDQARRDGVWIFTDITTIPENNREAVFSYMLKLNVLGAEQNGPVLAIEGGKIVLQQFLSVDAINSQTIVASLERFLNRAESSKKGLLELQVLKRATDVAVGPWSGFINP